MIIASSAASDGRLNPNADAKPAGVGKQKRAGLIKANNSITSMGFSNAKPSRLLVHFAWQTIIALLA